MPELNKIAYYDLKLEALQKRLPALVGREEELERLSRVTSRHLNNNCLLVGPAGMGKTALVQGWANKTAGHPQSAPIVQLDIDSFYQLSAPASPTGFFREAFAGLPFGTVIIDNFGELVHNKPQVLQHMTRLLKPLLEQPQYSVILVARPQEYQYLIEQDPSFNEQLEIINLKPQDFAEQVAILKQCLQRFQKRLPIKANQDILELIIKLAQRFPALGHPPRSSAAILDESLALALVQKSPALTEDHVRRIVADKTGVPIQQLGSDELAVLKNLQKDITRHIIGQDHAVATIVNSIQRAKLGLKNPHRPLGTFLLLGPSGVGKTETAKVLAKKIYGRKESFVRIDMSEFTESHTVQRLIGAPPGYIGYDAGGGLTNPVKNEPYSLVLLDELEKAHGKIFDVFLQILDDGRITSGQGETVDFTNTIIMATSNIAVPEILAGFNEGKNIFGPEFQREILTSVLMKTFRPEFLNRFDAIVIFKPLGVDELLDIALLEIKKIEQRVAKHNIRFSIEPEMLRKKITELADPRFGARPIKRYVEQACETLLTNALLNK